MATRIKLKNSTVLDKVPTTADIEVGELALNCNSGSPGAYIQDSGGSIVKLAGAGSITTPDATEAIKGIAKIATTAEVTAGVDDTAIITPAKLAAVTPPDASEAVKGIAKIATTAEVTAGIDDTTIITPTKLAGAIPAAQDLQSVCTAGTATTTGASFAGQVTIPETPNANASAASKKYVDDEIATSISAEDFWDRAGTTISPKNSGDDLDEIGSITATATVTANVFSGSLPYSDLTGKPTIPTNNNQLTNGEGYYKSGDNVSFGTVTASSLSGDGSQLTNIPETQDLQSVTDEGATTTLVITTAGYNLGSLASLP